jgi:hypothetical protein
MHKMPRGRKPANGNNGSNVRGDDRAELIDDFDAFDERLGFRPSRSVSRGGELGFDDID